jgi:cyclohexanone monooxygenase
MTTSAASTELDAVIVGAGFSGLYMLHKLRGLGLRARVFEAGNGVGGTWFWNRYPGARCDVESMEYSFKFDEALQQEWVWSERYFEQPEILRCLNHVADRFELRRDIALETRVSAAHFDERAGRWNVATDRGDRVSANFCIMATGCLSSTNTPSFSLPAQNGPLDPETQIQIKARYGELRALGSQMRFGFDVQFNEKAAFEVSEQQRQVEFEQRWQHGGLPFLGVYSDLLFNKEANETAAEFIRGKIRELAKDPELAALLTPDGVVGCKRLCSDTGYFETFNRANVTLVDVKSAPIETITVTGLRGGGGATLAERWAEGPKTYLGLSTVGFPNLWSGSPSASRSCARGLSRMSTRLPMPRSTRAAIRGTSARTCRESRVSSCRTWVSRRTSRSAIRSPRTVASASG